MAHIIGDPKEDTRTWTFMVDITMVRQLVAYHKHFGEINFEKMERNCLIVYGVVASQLEHLFTLSNSSQMHICEQCKTMANEI